MNIRNWILGVTIGIVALTLLGHRKHDEVVAPITPLPGCMGTQTSDLAREAGEVGQGSGRQDITQTTCLPPSSTVSAPHPNVLPQSGVEWERNPDRQENAVSLRDLLQESIAPARFVPPTAAQLQQFQQLFLVTLRQTSESHELDEAWNRLGWQALRLQPDNDVIVIREQDDQRRGRGIYAIRLGSPSHVSLQAPHRFYDTSTGLLARKFFEENDFATIAWNTVHRRQVDLAHRSDHFINAHTRALMDYDSAAVIVQLHGFSNDKQQGRAREVSMIVSDSTRYPGRLAQVAAQEFKLALADYSVSLFPVEVAALGGTQNQQAKEFHNAGREGFLHVEMNRELRETLASNASTRHQFFAAIRGAATNWKNSHNQ